MKKTIFAFGLVTGLAANLFAGETLRLKLQEQNQYNPGTRKSMQSESWIYRNAK